MTLHFSGVRANRNWYVGRDFVFMGSLESVTIQMLLGLNKHLNHIQFDSLLGLQSIKKPKFATYLGGYKIATEGLSRSKLASYILEIESAEKLEILAPETRYFSGERKKIFDLKTPGVYKSLEIFSDNEPELLVKLNDKVGIRYFLKGLLSDVSFRRIMTFPIWKTNLYHLRETSVGQVLEEVL